MISLSLVITMAGSRGVSLRAATAAAAAAAAARDPLLLAEALLHGRVNLSQLLGRDLLGRRAWLHDMVRVTGFKGSTRVGG